MTYKLKDFDTSNNKIYQTTNKFVDYDLNWHTVARNVVLSSSEQSGKLVVLVPDEYISTATGSTPENVEYMVEFTGGIDTYVAETYCSLQVRTKTTGWLTANPMAYRGQNAGGEIGWNGTTPSFGAEMRANAAGQAFSFRIFVSRSVGEHYWNVIGTAGGVGYGAYGSSMVMGGRTQVTAEPITAFRADVGSNKMYIGSHIILSVRNVYTKEIYF